MDSKNKQHIKKAFDSILRADYINIENVLELEELEKYYVDHFGILQNITQKQDSFISGRRGTGKTTCLLRGYFECLKTISPKLKESSSNYFLNEKVLPLYLDLSLCIDLFGTSEDDTLFQIHFVRQLISNLKKQLEKMFDESILGIFKRENPTMNDLKYIENILIEGVRLKKSSSITIEQKVLNSTNSTASASASSQDINLSLSSQDNQAKELIERYDEKRGLNIHEFVTCIEMIRKHAQIDSIYIFIDEYSDLSIQAQQKFSYILKSLLGSKVGMYFKVGVISDRYTFGEKIIIGRDIFPIPLDIHEYSTRFGGAIPILNKISEFVEQIIENRLKNFCKDVSPDQIFDSSNKKEIYIRIARESVGVSRTIGLILQNAWTQANDVNSKKIGLTEINYGIQAAKNAYSKHFQGALKERLIPAYCMDILNDIVKKALSEKRPTNENKPASHFLISPERKDYLSIMTEHYQVHLIAENFSSRSGGNYCLFAIDYAICLDKNIKYAEVKDDFTAVRFIYDEILAKYDPYFTQSNLKSYKCPKCPTRVYSEAELANIKVKRCFEHDELLEEIIHAATLINENNLAEIEIKILGLIASLDESEAKTAREIADIVGCTVNKVALWGHKVLVPQQKIRVKKANNVTYYYAFS